MENTEKNVVLVELNVVDVFTNKYFTYDTNGVIKRDEKSGEYIQKRVVYLTFAESFKSILSKDGKDGKEYVIGDTNRLAYSAYYLIECAKAFNKKVSRSITRFKENTGKESISLAAIEALFDGAKLIVDRTPHLAGDKYFDADGVECEYHTDGFDRAIKDIIFTPESIDDFKDEIAEDIRTLR